MASTLDILDDAHAGRTFDVMALQGEEALSELFSFRVAFLAPIMDAGDAAEADRFARSIIGSRTRLSIAFSGPQAQTPVIQPRYGVIASVHHVRVIELSGARDFRVDCTLVPRAWRMTLRKRSRVYQNVFVHEVVSRVLHEHGLVHRWSLGGTYARRQYCVQYQETDYDFVTRLLAEEGIAFYFEHWPADAMADRQNAPAHERPASHTLETVATGIAVGGAIVGGAIGLFSSSGGSAIGGGVGLVGDLLRGPERDPDAIEETHARAGVSGPPGEGDVFCLVDQAADYVRKYADDHRPSEISVQLHAEHKSGVVSDGREVFDLVPTRRMAPEGVEQRDHDFRRPLLELRADATRTMTTDATAGSASTAPALDPTALPAGTIAPLEIYEHHGEHDPPYVTSSDAVVRLDQAQADTHTAAGRTHCPLVLPGHVFNLQPSADASAAHAPATLVADGDYATIRVRHTLVGKSVDLATLEWDDLAHRPGRRPDRPEDRSAWPRPIQGAAGYINQIECVPAAVFYRPAYEHFALHRKPRATCETAVVVGPPGDEIHTDRLGRVKVQFHWDREGQWDDRSSCFLRVVQPWAGAGYGFQFLPRVGMEVLVTFVGGDPDRPVISGCLYDNAHPHPEPLPERATRSAIRTQSSPGGGGFNEIVFEDKKNEERLTIGAELTLEQYAKGAHTLTVGEDQRVHVSGNQQLGVAGEHIFAVGKRHSVQIGESRTENVGGNATEVIDRNSSARVQGSALRNVGGADVRVVGHDDVGFVSGTQSLTVQGNAITHVGDGTAGKGHALFFAQGSVFANAKGSITIQGLNADASTIKLVVGSSSISIGPHEIAITSENVKITGTTSVAIVGHQDHSLKLNDSGATMTATPTKIQNSAGSAVKLVGGCAMLTGRTVELKSPSISLKSGSPRRPSSESAQQQQAQTPANNLEIELTHANFHRQSPAEDTNFTVAKLCNIPCRVTVGGKLIEDDMSTNGEGVLCLHAPDGIEEITVEVLIERAPEHREQLCKLYPKGLSFLVKLLDGTVPAATEAEGKRIRLRNLGYETSLEHIQGNDLDKLTAAELDQFMADEELLESEHPDQSAQTRLRKLFGES